ncbi:hypothetical protein TB1_031860 [Malus domestica]
MMEMDFILELLAAVRDLELLVGEETELLLLLSLLLEDDEDLGELELNLKVVSIWSLSSVAKTMYAARCRRR